MILIDENELYNLAYLVEECTYFTTGTTRDVLVRVATQLFRYVEDPDGEYTG